MRDIENQQIQWFQLSFKFYIRYVDDVLTVWTNEESIGHCEEAFTLEVYGFKLRKEQLSAHEVHYLDIEIKVNNGILKMAVYRKPSYEPVLIPNLSQDPVRYKKTSFNYFFRRAILYNTDVERLNTEIDYIVRIGEQHGYSRLFVLGIYRNVKKCLVLRQNSQSAGQLQQSRPHEGYLTVPHN